MVVCIWDIVFPEPCAWYLKTSVVSSGKVSVLNLKQVPTKSTGTVLIIIQGKRKENNNILKYNVVFGARH